LSSRPACLSSYSWSLKLLQHKFAQCTLYLALPFNYDFNLLFLYFSLNFIHQEFRHIPDFSQINILFPFTWCQWRIKTFSRRGNVMWRIQTFRYGAIE